MDIIPHVENNRQTRIVLMFHLGRSNKEREKSTSKCNPKTASCLIHRAPVPQNLRMNSEEQGRLRIGKFIGKEESDR